MQSALPWQCASRWCKTRPSVAPLLTPCSRCPLGHLPHVVARQLAPLLRNSQVPRNCLLRGHVCPLGIRQGSCVHVHLSTSMHPAPSTSPSLTPAF